MQFNQKISKLLTDIKIETSKWDSENRIGGQPRVGSQSATFFHTLGSLPSKNLSFNLSLCKNAMTSAIRRVNSSWPAEAINGRLPRHSIFIFNPSKFHSTSIGPLYLSYPPESLSPKINIILPFSTSRGDHIPFIFLSGENEKAMNSNNNASVPTPSEHYKMNVRVHSSFYRLVLPVLQPVMTTPSQTSEIRVLTSFLNFVDQYKLYYNDTIIAGQLPKFLHSETATCIIYISFLDKYFARTATSSLFLPVCDSLPPNIQKKILQLRKKSPCVLLLSVNNIKSYALVYFSLSGVPIRSSGVITKLNTYSMIHILALNCALECQKFTYIPPHSICPAHDVDVPNKVSKHSILMCVKVICECASSLKKQRFPPLQCSKAHIFIMYLDLNFERPVNYAKRRLFFLQFTTHKPAMLMSIVPRAKHIDFSSRRLPRSGNKLLSSRNFLNRSYRINCAPENKKCTNHKTVNKLLPATRMFHSDLAG